MKMRISYWVTAVVLLVQLSTSCIYDKELTDVQENAITSKYISFTVNVAQQAAATRGDDYTWGDDYPSTLGTAFENRILTGSLNVYAYDNNGNYVATVQNISYGGTQQVEGIYEFFGVLQSETVNSDITLNNGATLMLVVAANCGSVTISNGIPDLDGLTFLNAWDAFLSQNSSIPMWGAKRVTISGDPIQDVGQIDLLRALAKVEILLDDAIKDKYEITSAKLTKSYTTGYSFPGNWNLTETPTLLHKNSFREYGEADALVKDVNMYPVNSSYMIYMPEIDNTNDDVRINLTIKDKTTDNVSYEFEGETALRFVTYESTGFLPDSPVPFNIVRNHYYRYIIKGVGSADLQVICDVRPYAEVNLRPGFGL